MSCSSGRLHSRSHGTRPDGTAGDPVTVAKALTEFGKSNDNLVIKGGLLEGRLLSTDEVTALSKIAPREELLARLAGGMAAPMQQLAGLLNALPQKFAFALAALVEQGGAPGAPEPAAEAESHDAPESEDSAEAAAAEADAAEAEGAGAAEADDSGADESGAAEADDSAEGASDDSSESDEPTAAEADDSAGADDQEADDPAPGDDSDADEA